MKKGVSKQNFSKIAIKNSSFSLIALIFYKFGGLIFTVILARALLPEFFGIYSLALSIVTIALTFTNLGIDQTFTRYFSEELGKNNNARARSYLKYFFRLKVSLIFLAVFALVLISKFLAFDIYNKPLLYHALIFSSLFLVAESLKTFAGTFFVSKKNLKPTTVAEFAHQFSKIVFAILVIFLLQGSDRIQGMFIAIALAGFIHLGIFLVLFFKDNKDLIIGKRVPIQRRRVWKYLGSMSVASLSLIFFGSVDMLMLGKFVDSEFIGYYRAALSLILTFAALFSLSNILLPLFTQIHKKRFERGFQKTIRAIMIFALPAAVGIVFVAKYLILLIYGESYLPSTLLLYYFAILIIVGPLIAIYTTIFESREKPGPVARAIVISLIINIILNYSFIKYFIDYGPSYIIGGVAIATVTSRITLLGILYFNSKSNFKLKFPWNELKKPALATLVMAVFLIIFNKLFYINSILIAVEVILGMTIYFAILILTKEINKEDFNLIKNMYKR